MPITVTETRTEERIVKFGDPGPCVSGGNKLNGSKNGVGVPGVNPKVFAPNVDHIWAKVKVASKFQKSLLQWLEWPIEWPPNESDESPGFGFEPRLKRVPPACLKAAAATDSREEERTRVLLVTKIVQQLRPAPRSEFRLDPLDGVSNYAFAGVHQQLRKVQGGHLVKRTVLGSPFGPNVGFEEHSPRTRRRPSLQPANIVIGANQRSYTLPMHFVPPPVTAGLEGIAVMLGALAGRMTPPQHHHAFAFAQRREIQVQHAWTDEKG
ncbi:hypothetical protein T484DRAFT_1742332 [Baffinella frigidus]|nr:hypothetical protein T484DRAFT_1742332 [Cryptophyta sp. CCMP2293]